MENNIKNSREVAINWWSCLKSSEKLNYWYKHQKTSFTPSQSPEELTGREIEMIYLKNRKIDTYLWHQFVILKGNFPLILNLN